MVILGEVLVAGGSALAPGSVRLSQKSHKVPVLLGIYCFPRFRSRTDGKEAAVARGAEGRWSSPRVVQSSPEARRCGRTHNSRL